MRLAPQTDPDERRTRETAVLGVLARASRMHVHELSEALEVHPTAVERTCIRLQRDGYVRTRGGDYSITARGERRLRQGDGA